jgi:hypothetical protein
LFVLDKPKQWLTRQDIPYYRETMGENYTPDHDDIEVKIAAKYLKFRKSNSLQLFYLIR